MLLIVIDVAHQYQTTQQSTSVCIDISILMNNFTSCINEALPHITSITSASNTPTSSTSSGGENNKFQLTNSLSHSTTTPNFIVKVVTFEHLCLTVEYQPTRGWAVLSSAPTSEPATFDIILFDSLHTLIGHFSRLYRQSFQAAVVAKLSANFSFTKEKEKEQQKEEGKAHPTTNTKIL